MKTFSIVLLAASLLLNAVIAALYVSDRKSSASAPLPATSASPKSASSAAPTLDAETWRALETGELPDLVARLRASGFPPGTVRAIIAAQVRESFAARRKALTAEFDSAPYWQNPLRDPKTQMALRALDREEQKAVRELLGPDAESDDPMMRFQRERGLEFLPTEKADEIRQIIRDYDERRSDMYASGFNFMTDRPKMEALDKEQHAAIARTLTADELLEYNLRRSRTADRLRDELAAFNPTEDEYRALFKVRAPFDEQFGEMTSSLTMNQAEMTRRFEAERRVKEQMKAVLAPSRAAEYDKLTDYNYRRTSQLVARLDLPPNTTDQLYAVQKDFEQRRNEMYRGVTSAAERDRITEQLRGLQQEATAKVTPILGNARAVEAYKQYGGNWITNLVPRPPPPRPGAATPAAPPTPRP